MSLPPEVRTALAAGQGLMVPDPARAAAIRLAYADEQLEAGRTVWSTPDVVTPATLLTLQAIQARRPLMSRATEWALLRQFALREYADRANKANSLADAWQRSLQLLRDLDISTLRAARFGTPESAMLAAAGDYLRTWAANDGIGAPALCRPQELPRPLQPRLAAGFTRLPAAYTDWCVSPANSPAPEAVRPASISLHVAAAADEEVNAAIAWARQSLKHAATSRILLIVPPDNAYERALQRALADSFQRDAGREPAILLDRQRRLLDAPAVRQQLFLLQLLAGGMPIADCCLGLRDGGRSLAERLTRAELAHFLQGKITGEVSLTQIETWLLSNPGQSLSAARQWLSQLTKARAALLGDPQQGAAWAERLATVSGLLPIDWRDHSPDQGFALQQAWQELLVDCAQLAEMTAQQSLPGLLSLLAARAARSAWPEARGDSRLHIVRRHQDPILHYDGIWVCGLAAAQWPRAPDPDAWLPKLLQLEAGALAASAAGRLQEAQVLLTAWQRSTTELHLSYPAMLDEHSTSISPLLAAMGLKALASTDHPVSRPGRAARILAAAPTLVPFRDENFSRRIQGAIERGPQILNFYNECAFRGAVTLRLLVPEAEEAEPGMDPLQSGTLLHEALLRAWRELGGSAGLANIPDDETALFAARVAGELVSERLRNSANFAPTRRAALAVEQRRLTERLTVLLAAERQRAAFSVARLEESLDLTLDGVNFRMRPDRIDRSDDRFLLIDYKSGGSGLPRWREQPPREIQLLIYREALLAQGIRLDGLVTWHLLAKKIKSGGALAEGLALPKPLSPGKPLSNWQAAGSGWSQHVQQLAARLWRGDAELRPLKGACSYCDLKSLCRRDERLGMLTDDDDDRSSDEIA